MAKSTRNRHNDGQKDRADKKGYNAPHGLLEELFTWPGGKASKKNIEDNKAYQKGWRNADKQK